MEAKELRIGNYFQDYEGIVFNVHGISIGEVENTVWYANEFGFYLDEGEYRPVVLTEEWLRKLGFKELKDTDIDTWWKLGWIINKDADGKWFTVKGDKVILDYVHELQNLYFAITKKELTIN